MISNAARLGATPLVWLCLIYCVQLCFQMSYDLLLLPLPVFALQIGGEDWHAGLLNALLAIGILTFRPLAARLIERRGAPWLLVAVAIAAIVSPYLHLLSNSVVVLGINRFAYAIVPAVFIVSIQLLIVDLVGTKNAGKFLGISGAVGGLSYFVAPSLALSWTLGTRGFTQVALLSSALAGVALVGSLILRRRGRREPYRRSSVKSFPYLQQPIGGTMWRSLVAPGANHLIFHLAASVWFGFLLTYYPVLLSYRGLDQGGVFFVAFAASSIVIRTVAGAVVDRSPLIIVVFPMLLAYSLGMFVLSFAQSSELLVLAGCLVGAGFASVQTVLLADLMKSAENRTRTTAAFANMVEAGLLLGALFGAAYVHAFSIPSAFLFGSIFLFGLAALSLSAFRRPSTSRR